MARTYAGIMALVGMTVVLFRALKGGQPLEGSVMVALGWMATLGVVGLIVGALAQATIDEAVRLHMERELESVQPTPSTATT